MMYVKEGINDDGVRYKRIEETTIYFLESETDLEKVVAKLNRQTVTQCGKEWLDVENEKERISNYPDELVIDMHDVLEFIEKNSEIK